MNGDKTLLIGGAGFVGRAITRRLLGRGHVVHVLSRRSSPFASHSNLHYLQGALRDVRALRELLGSCENIIYVASETTPGQTAKHPISEIERNLLPTATVIEALEDCEPRRVIYLSSGGTVYGNSRSDVVPEHSPLRPVSYHGATKVAAESFWQALSEHSGHQLFILRPSNLYGPDQPYQSHFGVIRKLLQHALEYRPVDIWGDGCNTRDYLYIEDFVDACMTLLTYRPVHAGLQTFNVGSGRGLNLLDLCLLVEACTGRAIERRYHPARSLDVKHIILEVDAIRSAIGWKPSTSIEAGLELTWKWLCPD